MDGNYCGENIIMIAALPQYLKIILLSSYCGASVLLRYDDYLLGRQIHLKAIFDISMCHPKVPYHYTFIMTTSRKKSQKFTQTNSKRPSKVKEAGSCFMTERRVSELSHIFLTYYVAQLQVCIQYTNFAYMYFFEILAGIFKRSFENA